MAGQERLSGHRPDQQITEPQLPKAEVGERAHQLIEGFTQALQSTPEFLQVLGKQYFTHRSIYRDNRFEDFIHFDKGDNHYSVRCSKMYNENGGLGGDYLDIERFSLEPDGQALGSEAIILRTYTTNNDTQFVNGRINIAKFGNLDEGNAPPENTQSAIVDVQQFLNTYFGDPVLYTPPYK